MGRAGTETAREAADIVLTDDDFATAVLAGLGAPMTVVQVLLVNVLTDGLPAVALSRDPASATAMERGPHSRTRLFGGADWLTLAGLGTVVGGAAFAAFLVGRAGGGDEQTMAFATVALAELVLVFSCRSPREPAWRLPRNAYLLASVALSTVVVALAVYVPALQDPFSTAALGAWDAAIVVALALVPAAFAEAGKTVLRAISENPNGGTGAATMSARPREGRLAV
jgi:Ca2+-transporting ATPase